MKWSVLLCCALALGGTTAAAGQAPIVNETLAAQVFLDRAGFSPGEIDGKPGRNFQRALTAFQKEHGLSASGQLDEMTWQQLSGAPGASSPLIEYTISSADVAGPFTANIPVKLSDQAALEALNFRSALEALAERVHSSPALLKQLNPGVAFDRAGDHIMVPNTAPTAAATPATPVSVVVTKSTGALTIEAADGHVLFHAPVTSGSEHDPLPIGTWKVNGVQRNPKFHYNPELFWDATPGDAKATLGPGPNNPVGIVWIDISKPHYGLHGTPEPSKIGHVESHGCVRLTNWDAERVAQFVKPGTRVVFRE